MKNSNFITKVAGYFLCTLLCAVLLFSSASAQFTLEPSKGDRFSYFLNGDVWEISLTLKSEFALKKFISPDGYSSTWIQNLSMTEINLKKLMEYLDNLPNINVGGKTMSSRAGEDNWVLDSFKIYSSDYYEKPVGEDTPPDLQYLMKMIRLYFRNGA